MICVYLGQTIVNMEEQVSVKLNKKGKSLLQERPLSASDLFECHASELKFTLNIHTMAL